MTLNRRRIAGFMATGDLLLNALVIGVLMGVFFGVAEAFCRKGFCPALTYLLLSGVCCLLIFLTNRIIKARAEKHGISGALDFAQGFGDCILFASVLPWGWATIRAIGMFF